MTTNLAVSLALKGHEVGICDMDIHGPNIPQNGGRRRQKLKISSTGGIIPFQAYDLKIASMSFLLQNPDDPLSGATRQNTNLSINCWAESNGKI